MPRVLAALIAFVAEHRGCGRLDGGLEGGLVRLACSCGGELAHPVVTRDTSSESLPGGQAPAE